MKQNAMMMAALAAALMGGETIPRMTDESRRRILKIEPKPPGNSKEYWFNAQGKFSTEKMRRDEIVFTCRAINDKNAIRKFNNWKSCQAKNTPMSETCPPL